MKLSFSAFGYLRPLIATASTELLVRFRQRLSFFRLLVLVMLCAAMVPPPGAGYAILNIAGSTPLMSADTALQAAAMVLAVIGLIVFGLMLDIGVSRDKRGQLQPLLHVQPTSVRQLMCGRFLANLIYALLLVTIAALVLSTTLFTRYGNLPSLEAFALYIALVAPNIVIAALIAMCIDLLLPEKAWLRLIVIMLSFSVLTTFSLYEATDVLGLSVLKQLMGDSAGAQQVGLGFVKSDASVTFDWQTFAVPLQDIFIQRVGLFVLLVCIALLLAFTLAPLAHKKRSRKSSGNILPAKTTFYRSAFSGQSLPVINPAIVSPLMVFTLVFSRLFGGAKLALLLLIVAFLLGFLGGAPEIALTVCLFVPFVILADVKPAELRVANTLECCEPAFSKLGSKLVVFCVIYLPMLLAAVPTLLQLDVMQAFTALTGGAALTAWLVWTIRVRDLPILGVSVAGMILYVIAFNNVPNGLDILGLRQSNPISLVVSSVLAILSVSTLCMKKSR